MVFVKPDYQQQNDDHNPPGGNQKERLRLGLGCRHGRWLANDGGRTNPLAKLLLGFELKSMNILSYG
jgi:hypothetical protein